MLIKLIFTHMTDPFLSFIYSKCQNPFHFVVYCAYYDFSYNITLNETQSFILQIRRITDHLPLHSVLQELINKRTDLGKTV